MQKGSLIQSTRASGTTVWEYRWRDRSNGTAVYRRIVVGTTQQYPSVAEARSMIQSWIRESNPEDPCCSTLDLTVSQLVEHYKQKELIPENTWKSYATKQAYAIYLRRWILPKWGTHHLGSNQACGCRSVVASTSSSAWILCKDQEHYERALQSRTPIRFLRQQSNPTCTSKRKAPRNTLYPAGSRNPTAFRGCRFLDPDSHLHGRDDRVAPE